MIQPKKPDIGQLFRSRTEIQRALRSAARDAAIEHKKLGLPLVIWRDGKTVLIPPDEIVIDPEPESELDLST
jgi:hypothetical protein